MHLFRTRPEEALRRLRAAYPGSRIVLISDGDEENLGRYQAVAREYGAHLFPGEHLYRLETCHLFVERWLRLALEGPERFAFKIDPDTRLWRRFSWLPGIPCGFGTLETVTVAYGDRVGHPPNIQGGCIGATREVVEGTLAAGVLTWEKCVRDARSGWCRNRDCVHVLERGKTHDDFLASWAIDAAGFPVLQHPEIASYWRNPVPNGDLRFAVTHPHKGMEKGPQ